MTRRGLAIWLASGLAAGLPLSAAAGPPKGRSVSRIERTAAGDIVATVEGSGRALRVRLAYLRVPKTFRAGSGCPRRSSDYAVTELALRMRLDQGVDVVPAGRSARVAYLTATGQRRFRINASFNGRIVRNGLARVARGRGRNVRKLRRLESAARRARRGIWSRCKQ